MDEEGQARKFLGAWFTPTFTSEPHELYTTGMWIKSVMVHCPDSMPITRCEAIHRLVCEKFVEKASWAWKLWEVEETEANTTQPPLKRQEPETEQERLLGDWAESTMKWTGVQWLVYRAFGLLEMSCGCAKRRIALNNFHRKIREWVRKEWRNLKDCCTLRQGG